MHDDQDGCPCGNPMCGGNGPLRAAREDAEIAQYDVTFRPVLAGPDSPGFIYSIGLSEADRSDVIFVGDSSEPTVAYLGMLIEMQRDGAALPYGRIDENDPRNFFEAPVWVVPAEGRLMTHGLGVQDRLDRIGSDRPARLTQIVMPDREGRFPWQVGYSWLDQQVDGPQGVPQL